MADTKEVTKPWDKLRDRYVSKNPGKEYGEESASDALVADILSELEEYDARAAEFEEGQKQSKQMVDLFNRDPRSSKYLLALASGEGNPIDYLLDIYGPDLLDALQSEEGRAKVVESNNKWLEKKASEESTMQARMDNYEKSINDLAAFAQEKGLSDEQAMQVFEKINQIGFDAIEGIYSRESYEMAYNAMNYAGDVEKARKEGERDGRNERIEEKLKKVAKPADMPPTVGGQGSGVAETKPRKEIDPFFAGIADEIQQGYKKRKY
jgi:hypothetical protein